MDNGEVTKVDWVLAGHGAIWCCMEKHMQVTITQLEKLAFTIEGNPMAKGYIGMCPRKGRCREE